MSQTQADSLFVMPADHASRAVGRYGSKINETSKLDRIAEGGTRSDNGFCTKDVGDGRYYKDVA